jgi:hypothetical protein
MITKTYRTRELKGLSLQIFINGDIRQHITFKRGCTLGSTATYTTSDPEVQKALESLGAYGVTYYLEKEVRSEDEKAKAKEVKPKVVEIAPEPAKEIEEEEVVDVLDAQTFRNLVELRNALEAKGIDVSQITNVKVGESIAKKNGYNYTIEKNA